MPQNFVTVKARQARLRAKVIEWEPWEHYRGIRDVPIEVSAMASQLKPSKRASRQLRAENSDMLQGETASHQSMDIDETFWAEEPVMPTNEKRVRQPTCPSSTSLTYLPDPAYLH
jgi:hypothetical protein